MISPPFTMSLRKSLIFKSHTYFNVDFVTCPLLPRRKFSNRKIHPLFKQCQLAPNVWRLEEKYFDSWNLANMYFVKGTNADLLVDTGIGLHNLPSYLLWSKVIKVLQRFFYYLIIKMHAHIYSFSFIFLKRNEIGTQSF